MYSIVVNGALHEFFRGQRGLRQGDPLSLLLFVIGMDYLSRILRHRVVDRSFLFHPKCLQLNITHLCFADDVMIFTKGTTSAVQVVKQVIDEFSAISGLTVSQQKCGVFICGVSAEIAHQMRGILNMPAGNFPFRYLGIPLHGRSLRSTEFQGLLQKLKEKVQGWQAKHLSYTGRLTLIQSVLYSIIRFWCSILFIPQNVME